VPVRPTSSGSTDDPLHSSLSLRWGSVNLLPSSYLLKGRKKGAKRKEKERKKKATTEGRRTIQMKNEKLTTQVLQVARR
jgi:hypothetical protein